MLAIYSSDMFLVCDYFWWSFQGGRIICIYGNWKKASSRLIAWAVISGVVGGGLCKFSLDGTGPIPINKNLWLVLQSGICFHKLVFT